MTRVNRTLAKPTARQEQAIRNLARGLGIMIAIPATKAECTALLYDLIERMNARTQGF